MAKSKVFQNLVGSSRKAKYPAVQGSELSVNMYPGKNGEQVYMESLPGIRKLSQFTGLRCRGCYVSTIGLASEHSKEDLFVVMGAKLYRIDAYGEATELGTLAFNNSRVCFAEAGGPRALLLIVDGASMYYYDLLEGGELKTIQLPERINGSGGTITPTHVAVVGGSIVVNDSGSGFVYYSPAYVLNSDKRKMFDIVDGEVQYEADGVTVKTIEVDSDRHVFEDAYGAQQYFSGESSSDNVNGLIAVGPTLYVFGPKSVDVFQRGSGEFEDWIRTSYTSTNSFGLEAPNSLSSIGGTVYFIASGQQYGKCIMKVSGTSFEKCSDEWLDDKLLKESTTSAYSFVYSVGEHQFVTFQLNSIGETWTYDTMDNGWHQRTSRDKVSGMEGQWRVGAMAYYREKFRAFTNDGLMCAFGEDYWYEDFPDGTSLPVIRHRQTAVITDNFRPFTFEELTVEANVGCQQIRTGRQPLMMLEVSKDGGMTYGNVRSAYFGLTGQYSHRVRWSNVGANRLCVIRITFSEPMDLVLTACSIRAEATAEEI